MDKHCKSCQTTKLVEEFTKGKAACKKCISAKTAAMQKDKRTQEKAAKIAAAAARSECDVFRDKLALIAGKLDPAASHVTLAKTLTEFLFAEDMIRAKKITYIEDIELEPAEAIGDDNAYILVDLIARKLFLVDIGRYVEEAKKRCPAAMVIYHDTAVIDKLLAAGFAIDFYKPEVIAQREAPVAYPAAIKTPEQLKAEKKLQEIESIKYLSEYHINRDDTYFVICSDAKQYYTGRKGYVLLCDIDMGWRVKIIAPESVEMAMKYLVAGHKCQDPAPVQEVVKIIEEKKVFDADEAIERVKNLPAAAVIDRHKCYVKIDWDRKLIYMEFGKNITKRRPDLPIYEETADHVRLDINNILERVYEEDD